MTVRDPWRWSIAGRLDGLSPYLVAGSLLISVAVTIPRFGPGIPMSVDTTSHLYRVEFFAYWLKQGVFFPSWSPDWYGGSPSILLYPPLGYYLTVAVSSLGLDPLSSYKLVDAIFYWLAPATVFLLSREFGLSRGESGLAALFFTAVPEVIENYLFFDRFPTVLSIPIFCIFIVTFHRSLSKAKPSMNVLAAILSMSALILTHHLSALIAGIAAVLMVLVSIAREGLRKPIMTLLLVAVGTVGLTAFWLVPFITSLGFFPENPFYNRNVLFPFIRFTYFGKDVVTYLLGIVQFILAVTALQLVVGRVFGSRLRVNAGVFFPILLSGMILFEMGELGNAPLVRYAGNFIVVSAFVVFLGQFILSSKARSVFATKNGLLFAAIWFVVFLWVGLGFFALPIVWLPYASGIWVKTMDVYRVWLYLALPMSALAAVGFQRSLTKLWRRRSMMPLVFISLVVVPVAAGVIIKMNYPFTNQIHEYFPYNASNTEIPQQILGYFRNDPSPGRILGIYVPFWIYVLPNYVGKPILDGWYPQTKLLTKLVNISDYRIDDLETTATQEDRIKIWRGLIGEADQLEVTWLIIGGRKLAGILTQGSGFIEQLAVPYEGLELIVFKNPRVPSYVEMVGDELPNVGRPNPDVINLTFNPPSGGGLLIIKEAYFPTWAATADGRPLNVQREDSSGYMLLQVPSGTVQVIVYQKPNAGAWNLISAMSLVIWVGAAFVLRRKNRFQAVKRHPRK